MKLRHRLVLLGLLGLTACATLVRGAVKDPKLHFEDASLTAISLDSATLKATFKVENPNPFGLKLSGGSYGFSFDGRKLFDGVLDQALELPASATTLITVPIRVPFDAIPHLLTTLATRESALYQVDGTVKVRTPISDVALPFSWKGTLPIPKLPTLSLSNARVENVSLAGARLVLSVGVDNPNSFPLPLEKLSANLSMNGHSLTHVGAMTPKVLAPKQVTTIEVPVELSLAQAGPLVSRALSGDSTVHLDGEAVLGGRSIPIRLSTPAR